MNPKLVTDFSASIKDHLGSFILNRFEGLLGIDLKLWITFPFELISFNQTHYLSIISAQLRMFVCRFLNSIYNLLYLCGNLIHRYPSEVVKHLNIR